MNPPRSAGFQAACDHFTQNCSRQVAQIVLIISHTQSVAVALQNCAWRSKRSVYETPNHAGVGNRRFGRGRVPLSGKYPFEP